MELRPLTADIITAASSGAAQQQNMKKLFYLPLLLVLVGCSGSGEMSKEEEKKMRQGLTAPMDLSKMNAEQRKGYEEMMQKMRGGGAPSAPPATTGSK